jgi:hypothetical protein
MDNRLFATGWVHAFEEDTPAGAVYVPRDRKLPLSRRPRERLELDANGTARIYVQGPDDRYVEQAATWHDEDGAVVIRAREGGTKLTIVDRSPDRLVVRASAKGTS